MGFYLRKSVRAGPFRFNFSKSGIGISTGIPGLRIGMGPRGNYVHMGRGGVYYRKTLSSPKAGQTDTSNLVESDSYTDIPPNTHEPLQDIDSSSVLEMTDSSSEELLNELNNKKARVRFSRIAIIVSIVAVFMSLYVDLSEIATISVIVACIATIVAGMMWDQIKKTTVLFYDFEDDQEQAFQALHDAFDKMANAHKTWHIAAAGSVKDKKYHAGADTLVKKQLVKFSKGPVPYIKSNISVPSIPVGEQTLCFFPDRLLVFSTEGVGAVSYQTLELDLRTSQFIEDAEVPRDTEIIGYTWKYVNKSGGPDKRFKDNKQIPVVLYEELHFKSPSGLNELIQVSNVGSCNDFTKILKR